MLYSKIMGNGLLYSKIIGNGLSNFTCYSNREIGDMKDRGLSLEDFSC